MTDIVERLRDVMSDDPATVDRLMDEAAAEIIKWRDAYERLWMVLLTVPCPGGGYTGIPDNIEPTVAACLAAGVCGCSYGDALRPKE